MVQRKEIGDIELNCFLLIKHLAWPDLVKQSKAGHLNLEEKYG